MAARIDVTPSSDLNRYAAWRSRVAGRPLAAVASAEGTALIVEGSLVVPAPYVDRVRAVTDTLAGALEGGAQGFRFRAVEVPPTPAGIPAERSRAIGDDAAFVVLEFDGEALDNSPFAQRSRADAVVSSVAGAGTLGLAARLQDEGLSVTPNWVGDAHVLPATTSSESGGADAYQLPENRGRTRLTTAWQLVEAWRMLGGPLSEVLVGVVDSGFWMDLITGACGRTINGMAEFPDPVVQWDCSRNVANAGGPALLNGPMWHGAGTAGVAVGPHRNNAGVAGAGGTVARPVLFRMDASEEQVALAIRLAVAWGVDVLNMSFGKTINSVLGFDDFDDDTWNTAFQLAKDRGVVTVVAAGNAGKDVPEDIDVRPACRTPGVITVGALGANDSPSAWSSSNFGGSVRIWAQGQSVTCGPLPNGNPPGPVADTTVTASGTSLAAPLVAGTVAMLKAIRPQITVDEAIDILTRTGWRGSPDPKVRLGLDAAAAVWDVMGRSLPDSVAEPNDTEDRARPLTPDGAALVPTTTGPRALSSSGDKDWWRFDLAEHSAVQMTLDVSALVVTGAPTTLVLRCDDPEVLPGGGIVARVEGTRAQIDVALAPPGRYRVLVMNGPALYDLRVLPAAIEIPQDAWEPNDRRENASLFTASESIWLDLVSFIPGEGSYEMTLHRGDEDWFRVINVRPPDGPQVAWVLVGQADSPVTVTVLDSSGRPLRTQTTTHNAAMLRLEPPSCYVRVSGDRPTPYLFTLKTMVDPTVGIPPLKIPWGRLPGFDARVTLSGLEDHYEVVVEEASPFLGLVARDASLDLVLTLLDGEGRVAAVGEPADAGLALLTRGLPAGRYVLRVGRAGAPAAGRLPLLAFQLEPLV